MTLFRKLQAYWIEAIIPFKFPVESAQIIMYLVPSYSHDKDFPITNLIGLWLPINDWLNGIIQWPMEDQD